MTQSVKYDFENPEFKRQWEVLSSGVVEITPEDEFKKMLAHSITYNKPLKVKCGIDPTNVDVHLGHIVPYKKMRQFQDFGHEGIVIIGDYTARIGDPTGKNESRPSLSEQDVLENAKLYMEQVGTVLRPEKTQVRFQSEWFKNVSLADVLKWASETTVAKLLSHDTFKNRLEENHSLGLHELFYPVLQGVDSVFIEADVELGGSDQKFNVLMGRDYLKHRGMRPQIAMLMPLIMGTDGQQKMSKSLGNYIGVMDEPFDKFGKVMSIPDDLMENYATYAANFTPQVKKDFLQSLKENKIHPNEAKKQLASNIVALFHGEEVGQQMRDQFERVFAKKKVPDDIESFEFQVGVNIIDLLAEAGLCSSKGEARRMIKQNAVSFVDGDKITGQDFLLTQEHKEQVLKVGKRRFVKLL